ncbi:MAG: ribosomal RNA small subunit methyltransferase G [Dehalococcoidia bacterium]|nr:MAG: ribosomal RNA small subunit methyltransferase G [Dehalococcoidia bacterium]
MTGRPCRRQSAPLGLRLSASQLDQFEQYAALLVSWNQRLNLTRVVDPTGIAIRHLADSLAVAAVWQPAGPAMLVDVGSGAGLPGLPLKILWPALTLTLIEAVGKKAAFLEAVVGALGLSGVRVVAGRAEEAGQQPALREQFDLALARGVAPLPVLVELVLPLVRLGGQAVLHQSRTASAALATAQAAITLLGGSPATVYPAPLPALPHHDLVAIAKVAPTPAAYPRRPGLPAQRPLGGAPSRAARQGQPPRPHAAAGVAHRC